MVVVHLVILIVLVLVLSHVYFSTTQYCIFHVWLAVTAKHARHGSRHALHSELSTTKGLDLGMSPPWHTRPAEQMPPSKQGRNIHMEFLELPQHRLVPDQVGLELLALLP